MLSSIFLTSILAGLATAQTSGATQAPAPISSDAPVVPNETPGAVFEAIMGMNSTPTGNITAFSNKNGTGVTFNINLDNFPDNGPFLYHIHEFPVPSSGNCTGTGPHFDPYNRTENPPCDSSDPASCQLGDLSGKWGKIPIVAAGNPFIGNFTDDYLSTTPGNEAFFGNRSFVIHNNMGTRIQCGNFTSGSVAAETTSTSGLAAATSTDTSFPSTAAATTTESGAATTTTETSSSSAKSSGNFTGTNAGAVATANGGTMMGLAVVAWAFL